MTNPTINAALSPPPLKEGPMEKQLPMSYVEATAISSMAEALEMILLAYTDGYNTTPRDREKRRLLEEGCSAISAYRTVMGKEVMQRIHREHCGHTVSTTNPQALGVMTDGPDEAGR
jgi:hypothetical protein